MTTLAHQLLGLGTVNSVYLATILPYTSSRDYWVTTTSQTPNSHDATRKALNDWELTVAAPFAGTFDTAAPVEVNAANVLTHNGGYWIVNGTPHFATLDQIHLTPSTHVLAASAISGTGSMLHLR